jgi:hypothetical protein
MISAQTLFMFAARENRLPLFGSCFTRACADFHNRAAAIFRSSTKRVHIPVPWNLHRAAQQTGRMHRDRRFIP